MKRIILQGLLVLSLLLIQTVQATDFSDEPVIAWKSDGYELLSNVNSIMKVISFTNAADHVNKGDYKITFKDPFNGTNQIITAYINVTRADNSSPMYIKFGTKDGINNRYAFVKVNKGVSEKYPLGDFKLISYALKQNKLLSDWNTTGTYDRVELVVSANTSGSTVKIAIEGRDDESQYSGWMNLQVDDANFSSGHGTMNNWGNFINIAFDNKYILDKNSSNGGTLSFRSQFNSRYYEYKLFNEDGSNISLGTNKISSFVFETNDGYWGYVGSNYENSTTSSGEVWSGKYYMDDRTLLHIGDDITSQNGVIYHINNLDTTNGFIMLTENGVKKEVSPFESITINSQTFYKSGRKLYPDISCNNEKCIPISNLTDGDIITINSNRYKIKATMIEKTKRIIAQRADYRNLDQNVTGTSQQAKVNQLESSVTNNLSNPNLDFDRTDLENVKTWFDNLDTSKVPLKVVDGKNIK